MNLLILLITLIVTPGFCEAPCLIHYTAHLDYPTVRGELCLHLTDESNSDRSICYQIVDGSKRFFRNDWKDIEKGAYQVYATINDKLVSPKVNVFVFTRIKND